MLKNVCGLLALAAGVVLGGVAGGQSPAKEAWTAISIPEMHCASCAKKVCTEVEKQTGVAKTQIDMKSKTIFVLAKDGAGPSPKSLWEAVEKADEVPTKLVGPSGTFTKKPQSKAIPVGGRRVILTATDLGSVSTAVPDRRESFNAGRCCFHVNDDCDRTHPTTKNAFSSLCGQPSDRICGRYHRVLADLSIWSRPFLTPTPVDRDTSSLNGSGKSYPG
ncbi:MAG: heavy-metal-associated domain-containing protein [Planctomycetes bacterium]|nr:heavy-metal-associated domain-containing protein [Planctomycetota bacterium]